MKTNLIHEVRRGLLIARVRQIGKGSNQRYRITTHRLFRNGDHWTESTRFGPDDIPLLRNLLDHAHTWIIEQQNKSSEVISTESQTSK